MKIKLCNGNHVEATYVKHLRTLTNNGHGNTDVDLYRLMDGAEVIAESPVCDGRATPVQIEINQEQAMFMD